MYYIKLAGFALLVAIGVAAIVLYLLAGR